MLAVAFAGTFAASLEAPVRAHLGLPCEVVIDDEAGIVGKLGGVDVLVTMAFTREMGAAARRLKLVQVPGAGLERIDRAALPAGTALANAYGHEAGIAEYVLGAMLTLTRDFARLDAALRRGPGRASGPSAPRRRRRGRSWPARPSAFSATGTSARRWPGAPGRSTWPSARSVATSRAPRRTGSRCSGAWRSSTRCSDDPTTSRSRCRRRPPHAG